MLRNRCALSSQIVVQLLRQKMRADFESLVATRKHNKTRVLTEVGEGPHPSLSGILVKVRSRLEGRFACEAEWFSEDELFWKSGSPLS